MLLASAKNDKVAPNTFLLLRLINHVDDFSKNRTQLHKCQFSALPDYYPQILLNSIFGVVCLLLLIRTDHGTIQPTELVMMNALKVHKTPGSNP